MGNFTRPGSGGGGTANRPNFGGGNTINRNPNNVGGNTINRNPNIVAGNTINRNTNINNINNTNINNISSNRVTNVTNVNRYGGGYGRGGSYGGGAWGGYGGGYRPNPYHAYHNGWVNGYWNGHYNPGWGWGNFGNSALGWGVGIGVASWGLGSFFNSWGYSSYVNPYYAYPAVVQQPAVVVQQPIVYDYSRPIDLQAPPPAESVASQAVATFDAARGAFQANEFTRALDLANQALQQMPNDPMIHEFRALCLFALGRFDEAAIPLYTVLSAGPGWDWTTLAGLYPDIGMYTEQLRILEAYCRANPKAASARFVLASLYMTQGSNEAAANMFKQVVALQPQDRLSAQLADVLTPKPGTELTRATPAEIVANAPVQPAPVRAEQPPAEPAPAPAPADQPAPNGAPELPKGPVPAKLAGTWSASPVKDVTISFTVDPAKGFTWKVTDRGQPHEFRGEASFENDTLALVAADQPPMVGTVTWSDDSHFLFKAIGAPPEDPGLKFSK